MDAGRMGGGIGLSRGAPVWHWLWAMRWGGPDGTLRSAPKPPKHEEESLR